LSGLTAIALSYQANKEAFRSASFRFEYTTGSSANAGEASAGRFSNSITGRGLYVFDEGNARYERNYEIEDLARTTTKIDNRRARASLFPIRMLCDGETTLIDRPTLNEAKSEIIHSPAIRVGADAFFKEFHFPLFLGSDPGGEYDLYSVLKRVRGGEMSVEEVDQHARSGGLEVTKLVVVAGSRRLTFWVDLDRGCIPLRILDSTDAGDPMQTWITINDDLTLVPNAGWLFSTAV
jgi:hypothetical protein